MVNDDMHLIDAAKILVITKKNKFIEVNWIETELRFKKYIKDHKANKYIITGFIASDESGHIRTLGFEGSDHSAAIFGSLFAVEKINIWTDLDGLYTADPSRVKKATVISRLSYNEAIDLAYFGVKIIHSQAIQVAKYNNIPLKIANFYRQDKSGTLISNKIIEA